MLALIVVLFLSTQAIEEQLFPAIFKILPQNTFNRLTTSIDTECGNLSIGRNDRSVQVRVCKGNGSILADGSTGEFNFTDGLQVQELHMVYTWNREGTPEDPFLLCNFRSPVTITRVIITFILLQDNGARRVPRITMFVSNSDANYPSQSIIVDYDASDAPSTGMYRLSVVPTVNASYRYWCIDMRFPSRTNWVIVSEVELYQDLEIDNSKTSTMTPSVTTYITNVTPTFVASSATTTHGSTPFSSSPLPSITPTISSSPPQTLFKFLQPQENPVLYEITPGRQKSVKLNCTAFYNGSIDDIAIKWISNNRVVYNDTESFTGKFMLTTILKVVGKSKAMFTCTFQHSLGWNNSRDFIFTTQEAPLSSSKGPILIILSVAGGVLLFALLVVIICLMVYCRCCCCRSMKQNKMKHVVVSESNECLGRTRVNSLYNASNPIREDVYYDKILYNNENTTVKVLNIYELYDNNASSLHDSNSDNSYESVYLEPIHPKQLMTASEAVYDNNDEVDTLLPYTSMYNNPAPLTKTEAPTTITWDNITPCKDLGNGQFGEVLLALTVNLSLKDLKLSACDDDKSNQTLVAIKILKDNDEEIQKAFEKEIKFMARLDHPNVIKVLGICTTSVPFLMMEYMENSDLNSFLKKHRYAEQCFYSDEVDLPTLIYIALQIVCGMKYLASCHFVHRDLAARNCLVGRNFVVKVADFGMSQNLYNSHYFVLKGAAILPIRWMATESFYGKFSVKTDVWSYGVTLWEIFTLCQTTPYDELNDQQLIKDTLLGPKRMLLPKPDICPDELYEVMLSCFVHEAKQRATFNELYEKLHEIYNKIQ